jgi:hypothetical protein
MEKTIYVMRDPKDPEKVWGLMGKANRHPTAYWSEFLMTRGNNFAAFLQWMHDEHGFEVADTVYIIDLPQR